mmetsp:Transcript_10021/g.30073  ORF Transcript_10021/g.30073 Transcript_10021/m.30073 type:complete len:543 (+) Transcript_10021:66-1694(+)
MTTRCLLLVALSALASADEEKPYEVPTSIDGAFFFEPFINTERWVRTEDENYQGELQLQSYGVFRGKAELPDALPADQGLELSSAARKHGISTVFAEPLRTKGVGLVVQFELLLKQPLQCGGAYLKLLSADEAVPPAALNGDTAYTLMFGPDKCGAVHKTHFILRHKSPVDGAIKECHLVGETAAPPLSDKKPHLYTAVITPESEVKILVDGKEVRSASLLDETAFSAPINPPKKVDDPDDSKPADWVDEPQMPDPASVKPDDWDEEAPRLIEDPAAERPDTWEPDEPLQIPDPTAEAPADWDADEDGEWEAPLVPNPKCKPSGCGEWKRPQVANPAYKGKWVQAKIDNPAYVGKWAPRQIDNPAYYYDAAPHDVMPIGGVGIELWTMQDGILFDNILVATDPRVAEEAAERTFSARKAAAARLERGDGWLGAASFYLSLAAEYARENALPVGVAVCAVLASIVLLCCCRAPARAAEAGGGGVEGEEGEEEEGEGEEDDGEEDGEEAGEGDEAAEEAAEAAEEEKPAASTSTARRRTRKATD